MEFIYDISNFTAKNGVLYGNEHDLYPARCSNAFPNGKKAFYVYNEETDTKVRFILLSVDFECYTFSSEIGVNCIVYKDKN